MTFITNIVKSLYVKKNILQNLCLKDKYSSCLGFVFKYNKFAVSGR